MNAHASVRAALLTGVAVFVSLPALAQETFQLDTVVLAESKREVQSETAQAETTIDQEEIDDRQAGTIAELVDSIPGVNLINGNTPSGSGINIRGFGANGTYGTDQKVAIQLDGASVGSEELYRIGTQLYTDPELYKSVTVVRGIAGTFEFGSGIVGGLVMAETKDAIDITDGQTGFKVRQTLQFGSNGNNWASSTIVAWQPTETFGVIGNYTYRHAGVGVDGSGAAIGTQPYNTPSYTVGALYTFGNSGEHAIRATYADTTSVENDVPYDSFGLTSGSFGNVDREVHARTATLRYTYDSPTTDLLNVAAILTYADQQITSSYIAGSSPLELMFPSVVALGDADHRYQTFKATLKNEALFATGALNHELTFGVEATHKIRADMPSAPGGTDTRLSAFIVDDITVGGLTLTPAARLEWQRIGGPLYAYYTNTAVMGGATARYEFGNSGVAVFGSAAYTQNMPIIDDLTTPAFMTQTEKAITYELGASLTRDSVLFAGDALSLKVNGYRTALWDVTSYSGVTDVSLYGVEVEASYSTASGFYTDVNANFMRGWDMTTGSVGPWRGVPADEIRLTLGKKFGEEYDFSYEAVYNFAQNRAATPTPASLVHNIRATYSPQEGFFNGAEFRFGVENVLDLAYTPHLATRAAPGRTVKFSIAKTF